MVVMQLEYLFAPIVEENGILITTSHTLTDFGLIQRSYIRQLLAK